MQVEGRRKSKVTRTYLWNVRNRGLMNIKDLGSSSAAATDWDLKGHSGNWTRMVTRASEDRLLITVSLRAEFGTVQTIETSLFLSLNFLITVLL